MSVHFCTAYHNTPVILIAILSSNLTHSPFSRVTGICSMQNWIGNVGNTIQIFWQIYMGDSHLRLNVELNEDVFHDHNFTLKYHIHIRMVTSSKCHFVERNFVVCATWSKSYAKSNRRRHLGCCLCHVLITWFWKLSEIIVQTPIIPSGFIIKKKL